MDELEYAILFPKTEFVKTLARTCLKKSLTKEQIKFCNDVIKAVSHESDGYIQKSMRMWKSISENKEYTSRQRSIAKLRELDISKTITPKISEEINPKIDEEIKNLKDDDLILKIHTTNTLPKKDKPESYAELSDKFGKLGYTSLSIIAKAFQLGKQQFSTGEEYVSAHEQAAKMFLSVGATELYHQALGTGYVYKVQKDNPQDALSFIKKAASEFEKGHASNMQNYLLGNHCLRLAKLSRNANERASLYKQASEYFSKSDEGNEFHNALGDYYFEKSTLEKSVDAQISFIRKAAEHYTKANNLKKYHTMEAVVSLLSARTRKTLMESANDFKEAADWFEKAEKKSNYYHMLALYNYTSFGVTEKIDEKLLYLQTAEKYYGLAGNDNRIHLMRGLSFLLQAGSEKDLQKSSNNYKLSADELKLANDDRSHKSLGMYYYVSSLLQSNTKEQIDLLLKAVEEFHTIGDPLEHECIGRASFLVGLASGSKKDIETSILAYEKSGNTMMIAASKCVYYELLAAKESDEEKKQKYYAQAASDLKQFIDNLPEMQVVVPSTISVEKNLDKKLTARYEHLMGLSTITEEKEKHFRKSEELYVELISEEKEDKIIGIRYAELLQDWNKLDQSHKLLKQLSEKYKEDIQISKQFELNGKLLLIDWKRSKEDLSQEKIKTATMIQKLLAIDSSFEQLKIKTGKTFLEEILEYLAMIGVEIESKSPTYCKLSEEEIRDAFHTSLNVVYKGRATTETFRLHGKTDIHITNPELPSEVIVIEFKLWDGKSYYQDGIDQLLKYTLNRDENAILVTINKDQEMNSVLDKSKNASVTHGKYVADSITDTKIGIIKTAFYSKYEERGRLGPLGITHILFDISKASARKDGK